MTKPTAGPTANGAAAWLRRIRYRHLEVLLAISRHGSLTAAAAALDMTQPAASQWLADIESAAGARLFERGRRLRPTAFAAPVLAHAERVLNDAQRVVDELDAIRSGGTGQVRLGMMQVAAASLVPTVALALRKTSPGIGLTVVEDVAAGLWARFERNELDMLVTRLDARALGSGLPHQRLFADQHRIVCGVHHPLLSHRRPTWRDLARCPWVMPPPGTPLRNAVEMTFATAGIALPEVLLSSASSTNNSVLLSRTDALGVMSSAAAAHLESHGVLRSLPLVLTHDMGDVGLVWREARPGPAIAALLQAFERAADDAG